MKKICALAILIIGLISKTQAQWVTIPDPNFVNYLNIYYPAAMNGNLMDTTSFDIVNEFSLDISNSNLSNIYGVQFFDDLNELICSNNNITQIPPLPADLQSLDCSFNQITQLPNLPTNFFSIIDCSNNLLNSLPTLPIYTNILICTNNLLNSLPVLTTNLTDVECDYNQITSLPVLPIGLLDLTCSHNLISLLPNLPSGLLLLICNSNQINQLQALPSSLSVLDCSDNLLIMLPTLPASVYWLDCSNNQISQLPTPLNVDFVHCGHNNISFLPSPLYCSTLHCEYNHISIIPEMEYLSNGNFSHNNLSYVPDFTGTLQSLDISNNPNLDCAPNILSVNNYSFDNTMISCIPNYPQGVTVSSPSLAGFPICTLGGSCPLGWNIQGNLHEDVSANCHADSLSNGNLLTNIKVNEWKNGNIIAQYFSVDGEFSFHAGMNDTVNVFVDTAGLPISVVCPASFSRTEIITPLDSLKQHQDFGFHCNGLTIGTSSIQTTIAVTHPYFKVTVNAGDLSQIYNMICASGEGGMVTTTIQGPVTYYSPAAGALTPTVNGQVLTYNVSDFGSINSFTSFNFIAHLDSLAPFNAPVCFQVIANSPNDPVHSDDTLNFCTNVHSGYDPNFKDVYPNTISQSGSWLTYTIGFQNTGNDTTLNVVVMDTFSSALDPTTFKFLASSFPCNILIQGNVAAFTFHHIYLVDSATNEPMSHGWVQFDIKTLSGIPIGNSVSNTASIYFDGNAPVQTNAAIATATNGIKKINYGDFSLSIIPNPADDFAEIVYKLPFEKDGVLKLLNALGQCIQTESLMQGSTHSDLDVTKLPAGIYLIQIMVNGYSEMKKMIVE